MSQSQNNTAVQDKVKVQKPKEYKVIIHNDDYTPMEFVISVLVSIFKKGPAEAYEITMNVHKKEKGIAGIYTRDVAQTKMTQANAAATENKFPLKCTMEPN